MKYFIAAAPAVPAVPVFIDNGKGRAPYCVGNPFNVTQGMDKSCLPRAHAAMKGKNRLRGELLPELPGGVPDILQLKTELHGVKISVSFNYLYLCRCGNHQLENRRDELLDLCAHH
jgi:hypothetical protein